MFRYAQINLEIGIVECDSWLSGEVNEPHMIPIADDFDLSGKKYDLETGEWVEYIPEPTPEPEPTELEQLRADLDYMAIMTGIEL